MSDVIRLSRDVEGIAIPAGHKHKLGSGTEVVITQELGGTFTVHATHEGGLFRIEGKDADALGRKVEVSVPVAHGQDRKSTRLNSSHEWISRMPSSA